MSENFKNKQKKKKNHQWRGFWMFPTKRNDKCLNWCIISWSHLIITHYIHVLKYHTISHTCPYSFCVETWQRESKLKVLMKLKPSTHYMDVGNSSVKGREYRSLCGALRPCAELMDLPSNHCISVISWNLSELGGIKWQEESRGFTLLCLWNLGSRHN